MFNFLNRLVRRIKSIFGAIVALAPISKSIRPYQTLLMEELPDRMDAHTIYVLGEGEYTWSASMLCPCGCGDILHMSLHKEGRPRWRITSHNDGTVSLSPSINRMVGCKSHFFFEFGSVRWSKL